MSGSFSTRQRIPPRNLLLLTDQIGPLETRLLLREQPEQVGYREQDPEDHQSKQDGKPESFEHSGLHHLHRQAPILLTSDYHANTDGPVVTNR